MLNITLNDAKNGIEIRFENKPIDDVLVALHEYGFHWSDRQKMWYAKQTDERVAFANSLMEKEHSFISDNKLNQEKTGTNNLWKMTRIDDIGNNFEKYHIYDNKEIAAIIRKHLRERFPMCKWSVVKNGYNSINVHLVSSPFAIDSDEVKAIVHYAYTFAQSYNYDNSDLMSDYHNVNFYGVYENDIASSYHYKQREATVAEYNMSNDFQTKKVAFEQAEHEREERAFQERMAQEEIENMEAAKLEEERKTRHEVIESGAEVKEVSYFVLGCDTTNTSKEDKVSGYNDDCDGAFEINHHRENCHVCKEVYFTPEVYELFANQLMDDYSFLTGMGGSATDDRRINTMSDYNMMTGKERETVEWYNHNCVAIFCGDELKLVVDPQGCNYARYVFFVDEESKIVDTYHTAYGISEEESEKNKELADELYDVSTDIILNNEMVGDWNDERFTEYKQHMKDWIYQSNFSFNIGVVRAIESEKLKAAMYKLLTEINGIQEQFIRAGFVENQKITIIRISDFGGMSVTRGHFKSFECRRYAQYENAIKLVYRPERKQNDHYIWLYRDVLIFDGWHNVSEDLLWETIDRDNGVTIHKSRFMSCDHAQYDVILEYFKNNGIKPLVNTYNPQFN